MLRIFVKNTEQENDTFWQWDYPYNQDQLVESWKNGIDYGLGRLKKISQEEFETADKDKLGKGIAEYGNQIINYNVLSLYAGKNIEPKNYMWRQNRNDYDIQVIIKDYEHESCRKWAWFYPGTFAELKKDWQNHQAPLNPSCDFRNDNFKGWIEIMPENGLHIKKTDKKLAIGNVGNDSGYYILQDIDISNLEFPQVTETIKVPPKFPDHPEHIMILIEEEYGYRDWLWYYPRTPEELKTDWLNKNAPITYKEILADQKKFKGHIYQLSLQELAYITQNNRNIISTAFIDVDNDEGRYAQLNMLQEQDHIFVQVTQY